MTEITDILEKILGRREKEKGEPTREHELQYDSPTETLEPVYFWILDFMNTIFGGKVEKLVDNFSSSPGSGHFSEQSQKRTILQENAMKNLGAANQVMKAIINIIYDLKDFEIRLEHYTAAKSEKKSVREAGVLALKQIWMDNVDIKRGQGSINALASGNLQFVTLRDAFLATDTIEQANKVDLNERVKRILKPRIAEFIQWRKLSEKELHQRFSIEKNYLKSQVSTLKLYARWIKPYLTAATELEMEQTNSPELVTVFNTLLLELTLIGKREMNVDELIHEAELPKGIKKPKRKYYSIVIVDFHFRGIPNKPAGSQHYAFGGKTNVTFKGYALNEDELKFFEQELGKSEVNDVLQLIEGITTDSLDELTKDIDHFIKDEGKEKEKKKAPDTNPFTALFGAFKAKEKPKEKEEKKKITLKEIKKDNWAEKLLRKIAQDDSEETCYLVFDIYKKAHGMASHPDPYG